MNAMLLIATNTVRQTIRQRLFYNLVFFGIGMVLLAMTVGNITFGYADRVVRSIGLSGVSITVDLMALLVGVSLIHEEIDRKTLFVVLARPLSRSQYVLGRYLGLLAATFIMLVGLTIVFAIVLTLVRGSLTTLDVIALALAFPEAAILGGIGVVLSCFTTPSLGAGMGLGLWIISTATDDLVRLTEGIGFGHDILVACSWILPSLARLNFREAVVYQQQIAMFDVAAAAAYGFIYAGALAALSAIVLSRREMM